MNIKLTIPLIFTDLANVQEGRSLIETLNEVLVDNTVGGREEGQDVGDEVTLIVVQAVLPT
jgi:hypothetical protein